MRAGRGIGAVAGWLTPLIGLVVVVLVFFAIPPHSAVTLRDAQVISTHAVIVGVCALGMTLVIMSGGIDLSVGSAIALVGVVVARVMASSESVVVAVGAGLAVGVACGLYNGLLISVLRLPAFIATLGTLGFFRGLAKWVSGNSPVSAPTGGLDDLMSPFPSPSWLVFAPGVWLTLALAVVVGWVVHNTTFGRHTLAIGSREETARLCGVRVRLTKAMIYAVAGLFFGIGGALQFGRLTQGDPTIAVGIELDVIAAVVIGGASLSGGRGSILGSMAGAVLMAYMRNRCVEYGWPNFVQEMIVGHIIIAAVLADRLRSREA